MLFLKHIITAVQLCLGMMPLCLSIFAIQHQNWALTLLALMAVFLIVAILPLFRKRESLWVLFFVLLTATPANIAAISKLLNSFIFEEPFFLINIIRGGLIFMISLSIEELVCGLIARLIWKKQYKTVMMQE